MAKLKRKQRCVYVTDELWHIISRAARIFGVTKSVFIEGLILTSPGFQQLASQSAEETRRVAEELQSMLQEVGER